MGSRIAVMHRGKIQQLGTPQEIYDRPENLFVASFVGTPPMNLFPATLDDGRAAAAGFSLPIPARLRPTLSGGTKVVLGIRPEDLVISREEARGPSAPLPLSVDVVEPLGDAVLVHGRAGEAAVVGKLEPHQVPRVGERFDLWVELEKMHVFDAATERRVDSAGSPRPE